MKYRHDFNSGDFKEQLLGDWTIYGGCEFVLDIVPPTVTAQMKRMSTKGGHVRFFKDKRLQSAEDLFLTELQPYAPGSPMQGAIVLAVDWNFPTNTAHRHREWKTTRPDLDNMQKLLKDCMTKLAFWNDDSQVVIEVAQKSYDPNPHITVQIAQLRGNGK